MDIFIDLINWILGGMSESIEWLIDLLPESPTSSWQNEKPEMLVLSHVTWFIPFPTMLLHLAAFLTVLGVYYVYRIVARWLKVVRS